MNTSLKAAAGVTALAATLALSGCNTGAPMNNAQTGAIAGSVLGGIVGNQFGKGDGKRVAAIAGAILGGYIGGQMGQRMDAQDRGYIGNAVNTGQPARWQNANTGYSYTATPGQVYQANYQGQPTSCRPVFVDGYIDGRVERIQMNACRAPNGQWQATQG